MALGGARRPGHEVRPDTGSTRYAAFISYSRAGSDKLAPALRRALQRLGKPWYRLRALRVFLDVESQTAVSDLWSSIESALQESEFLIVVGSASAANSPSVEKEVAYWLSNKPYENILLVVAEENLPKDELSRDIIWGSARVVPPSLVRHYAEKGSPRFVDLAWARHLEQLDLRDPTVLSDVADLAAKLHHRAKDDMVGEEVRQYRRTQLVRRLVTLTLALLTLIAGAGAFVAVNQRQAALLQLDIATSRQLSTQAELISATDPQLAMLLDVAAFDVRATADAQSGLARQLARTNHLETIFNGHGGSISAARVHDGILVAADVDGNVSRFDVRAKKELNTYAIAGAHGVLSPDSSKVVVETAKTTDIWDIKHQSRIVSLPNGLSDLVFSPDGRTVAARTDKPGGSGSKFQVTLWDIRTGSLIETVPSSISGNIPLAFSPRSDVLALSGKGYQRPDNNSNVILWEIRRKRVIRELRNGHERGIFSVAFSPDGKRLVTGGHDARLVFWNIHRQVPERILKTAGDVNAIQFRADGRTLVTGDGAKVVTLWDVDRGAVIRTLKGHTAAVTSLDIDNQNSDMIVSGGDDGKVIVWSLPTLNRLLIKKLPMKGEPISFSPDGDRLAIQEGQSSISLYNLSGQVLDAKLPSGLLSTDWKVLFTDGNSGEMRDSQAGIDVPGISPLSPGAVPLAASANGTKVAAVDQGNLRLWDSRRREFVQSFETDEEIGDVALSVDGKQLATTGLDKISIFRTNDGQPVRTLPGHNPGGLVQGVAFSPDDRMLVSSALDAAQTALGCAGCDIILWDLEPNTQLATLIGHTSAPGRVAFSPDAKMIASSSGAETILWSADQRASVVKLSGAVGPIVFRADSRLLATQNRNGYVQLWDVDVQSWRRKLCAIAGRSLTPEEWASYLPARSYHPQCGS
jgi:WD40 repeat protein